MPPPDPGFNSQSPEKKSLRVCIGSWASGGRNHRPAGPGKVCSSRSWARPASSLGSPLHLLPPHYLSPIQDMTAWPRMRGAGGPDRVAIHRAALSLAQTQPCALGRGAGARTGGHPVGVRGRANPAGRPTQAPGLEDT